MEAKLMKLKEEADYAYYNTGNPIMEDLEYDALCQKLKKNKNVGCLPPDDSNKIKLPIFMGSLTKFNEDKLLNKFLKKFNHKKFIIQEKLDGVSCLYKCQDSKIQLFTRGNGILGTDITHLINYGLKLPLVDCMVRGELIMKKKIFKDKYTLKFKNIRNMISGQVNAKHSIIKNIISDMEFVAYEVILESSSVQPSIIEQYSFLNKHSFNVVYNDMIERELLNQKKMMDILTTRKKQSEYEIDGLVISIATQYIRSNNEDPKYSFAFKIQGETAEVKVDYIEWNLSKSGKYNPLIYIKPIKLSGVNISCVTGHHAKRVVENNITPGTTLLITRGGDVIPHIVAVLETTNETVNLPENSYWKSVNLYHKVDKVIPNEVIVKQLTYFFTSLNCVNCKDKTILKIYNAGYKSIESIIQAKNEEIAKINGIGNVLSIKILDSIKKNIKDASYHELLAALNAFGEGIGFKKIANIDLNHPEKKVNGLSEETIKTKILPRWEESLNRVKNIKKLVGVEKDEFEVKKVEKDEGSNPLSNKIYVFTGFRDTILENQIIKFGGKVTSAISKKTTNLIIASKETSKLSKKLIEAQKLRLTISTKEDLLNELQQYNNLMEEIDYDCYSSSDNE